MLTFFATLLVNVLIGTIFYLVISLRIEKSASELHVKKIRKEMDDMIREFNQTADRNISLLENRIAVMNRLLEKKGASTIDFVTDAPVVPAPLARAQDDDDLPARDPELEHPKGLGGAISHSAEFILSIGAGLRHAIREVNTMREAERAEKKARAEKVSAGDEPAAASKAESAAPETPSEKSASITREERDVEEMFAHAADRKEAYAIVRRLYEQGYSVDNIARLSGIPSGEIFLVAQLGGR